MITLALLIALGAPIELVKFASPAGAARLEKAKAIVRDIADNVGRGGDFVIVSYLRAALGPPGGGHHSPVGAYDDASRSFLVLDTNPTEGKGWTWAPGGTGILPVTCRAAEAP